MTAFSSLYGERLSRELGNPDVTNLFTTARRQSAINEGQRVFAEMTRCLERRSSITVTGGTAEYDLNSTAVITGGDFLELLPDGVEYRHTDASSNVQILAGDDLPRRDVPWLNRYWPGWQTSTVSSGTQTPSAHYLRRDGPALFLGFTPVPSTGSSESAEVFVSYLASPTDMSSGTDQPFTVNSSVRTDLVPYHQALVHYGASQLEKFRRDDDASDRQLQRFMAYVTRYLQAMRIPGPQALTFGRNYFRRSRGMTDRPADPRT